MSKQILKYSVSLPYAWAFCICEQIYMMLIDDVQKIMHMHMYEMVCLFLMAGPYYVQMFANANVIINGTFET